MTVNTHPSITVREWLDLERSIRSFNNRGSIMDVNPSGYHTSFTREDNRVKPIVKITSQVNDYTSTVYIESVTDLYQELDTHDGSLDVDLIWLNDGIGVWVSFNNHHTHMHKGRMVIDEADIKVLRDSVTMISTHQKIVLNSRINLPNKVIGLVEKEVQLAQLDN